MRVREQLVIDAPPATVFAWFDDLANAPLLVANLVEVSDIEVLENGGRRVAYRVATRSGESEATSVHTEYTPPVRTVSEGVQSGITTTATREFLATDDGGTLVRWTAEWDVPVRYVSRIVTAPLRGPLRRSLRAGLAAARDSLT